MSKVVDIVALRKSFTDNLSIEQWREFAEKQHNILEQFHNEIQIYKDKNRQLENLLSMKYENSLISQLSPEETICIQQIHRLEKQSSERQLTLEEVKQLDLLVKNLKLIREESTIVINSKSDDINEAELVAIARESTSSNT